MRFARPMGLRLTDWWSDDPPGEFFRQYLPMPEEAQRATEQYSQLDKGSIQ
jgi:hypothetical protein